MNCPSCGKPNGENASACYACGAALAVRGVGDLRSVHDQQANPYQASALAAGAGGPRPQINNYLVPAIVSTLCCCIPFGIVSIVYAAQVNGLLAAGDVVAAQQKADNAKMWFWIAFSVGLVVQLLNVVAQFGLVYWQEFAR